MEGSHVLIFRRLKKKGGIKTKVTEKVYLEGSDRNVGIFPVGNGLSRILSVGMKESKDFAVLIQQKRVGIKLNEKLPYTAHRAEVRSESSHVMIFPDNS